MEGTEKARKYFWLIIITSIVSLSVTVDLILIKYKISKKLFYGIEYSSWVDIFCLSIGITAIWYDQKKKNNIPYLNTDLVRRYPWIVWPIFGVYLSFFMALSVGLFQLFQ